MRISTSMLYELGLNGVQQQTSALIKTQQQIASGRRMLSPEDDPVAAARVLEVSQSKSLNGQFGVNTDSATGSLALEEGTLAGVGNLLQDVKTLLINAGNASLNHGNLAGIATDLRGRYQELLGLANTNDSNGQYLFSGYQGATRPFTETAPGTVVYNGDQGQRLMQISPSRQIAVSDTGLDIFQNIRNGNGTFVTAAVAGNTGTGIVSPGNVLNPAAWNSPGNNKDFTIRFAVNAGVTTYDIVDNVSGNSLLTGAPPGAAPYPRTFTPGSAISLKSQGAEPPFDFGAELSIQGAPANGDQFSVMASANESMFTTLDDVINALESASVPGGQSGLINSLNTALSNLDNGLDQVLTVRASVGARMKEIEAVKNTGEEIALQYDKTLSGLQDLDYAKAISDLARQQAGLEAAQKSFLKVQGLSLFNYI